jgi:hypothetical protein
MKQERSTLLSKKIMAHEVVTIRAARGGEYAPSVIPLPKSVSDAMKFEKGTKVHIYTDGERVYVEKLEEPKI